MKWASSSSLVVGCDASRKVASETWLADGPSADGAFRYQLRKDDQAQGHGAGLNWLVFLKSHP